MSVTKRGVCICDHCGKFARWEDAEVSRFEPDNAFGPEVIEHECHRRRASRGKGGE